MARITQQASIRTTGVSYENEPILKSDGSGEIMQWQPSDGGADGLFITESSNGVTQLGLGVTTAGHNLMQVHQVDTSSKLQRLASAG